MPAVVVTLPATPRSASQARAAVREKCSDWHLDALTDSASVVVSELVGNAVRHGGSPVSLTLRARGRVLTVEVYDGGAYFKPRPLTAAGDDQAENGRGMMIVRQVSRVRVLRRPTGKTVRAVLTLA